MYFPPIGQLLVGVAKAVAGGGARTTARDAERTAVRRTFQRDSLRRTRIAVKDGVRRVELHPLGREGSYVREVHVRGVSRQRVIDALPGPATGPNGFAPNMVTATPLERQFKPGVGVRAEKMRLPGLPESMGATVAGKPTRDGMAFEMVDGLTTGGFTLKVGPERVLADGATEVTVTEAGRFALMRGAPASIWGVPAWIFNNLTPFGWMLQATGGAAVSDAHIGLFELGNVLRRRLGAG